MVRASAPSLVSAVLNLATNALQAATSDIDLELLARRADGGRAQILVSDNGPGVPAQIRERIFEPFFTTRVRGNGIGLAIVNPSSRRIKAACAWSLRTRRRVRDRFAGRGKCMNKVNDAVLVVEDDAALREALVDTLNAAGLAVLQLRMLPRHCNCWRARRLPW